METAKVVSGSDTRPKPIPSDEAVDAYLDVDDQATQYSPQQLVEQQQLSRETTASASEKPTQGDIRRKPFSKILRIARPKTEAYKDQPPISSATKKRRGMPFRFATTSKISTEQENSHKRNTRKRSPQSRPRSSRDNRETRERRERKLARRMPRASSSQEGLPRVSSLKRISLARSSSERQYGTEVMRAARVSPRSNSRRWQGDDFSTPRPVEEEGELDSFFRFMEECTEAVLAVFRRIPVIINQLPEITMDILKRLIPALRGPTAPLIEGPRDENDPL